MRNMFGHSVIVSKEEYEGLNFNERISKLEKIIDKMENQLKELTERQNTLIQAVGILCMKDFQEYNK